jgi:hypothetical protein
MSRLSGPFLLVLACPAGRWVPWLWSEKVVQPPIIDRETVDQVQAMIAGRAHTPAQHKAQRAQRP